MSNIVIFFLHTFAQTHTRDKPDQTIISFNWRKLRPIEKNIQHSSICLHSFSILLYYMIHTMHCTLNYTYCIAPYYAYIYISMFIRTWTTIREKQINHREKWIENLRSAFYYCNINMWCVMHVNLYMLIYEYLHVCVCRRVYGN